MTLDELRASNPDLSVAVYALTPGGDVTMEIIMPDGETIFSFTGATVAEAIAAAGFERAEISFGIDEEETETEIDQLFE